ncbi:MAG: ATP-binding protein [Armatimonadetes bacterium]|nr:ATP-binding protein [Armatimonadota bacterium]
MYGIDEPELHLHTAIQRKLLITVERLIPENCQLWVATHSVGFLRALQDELADKCAILDFSEKNYFVGTHTIRPMSPTRGNWQRVFDTALDDLVGLIAPQRIVYCEGRTEPTEAGAEQGLDALVYNEIFEADYPTTLFISSGGTNEVRTNGSLAIKVLKKAFLDVELLLLHDRDERDDAERSAWLTEASHHRMLERREIENYLFDFAVLESFCAAAERPLLRSDYDAVVKDVDRQGLKAGQTTHQIKVLCGEHQTPHHEFKQSLARYVRDTAVYQELLNEIFGGATEGDGPGQRPEPAEEAV